MKCFVYGTLKREQCRNSIMGSAKFIGEAQTQVGEFAILNCGTYPALAKVSDLEFPVEPMSVHGELYEIDTSLLTILDQIEGYPYLYTREVIELADGEKATAYLYAQPSRFSENALILNGVWDDSLARR